MSKVQKTLQALTSIVTSQPQDRFEVTPVMRPSNYVTSGVDPARIGGDLCKKYHDSDDEEEMMPASIFDEKHDDDSEKVNVGEAFDMVTYFSDAAKTRSLTLFADDFRGKSRCLQDMVTTTMASTKADYGSDNENDAPGKEKKANLGTFFGVFLPCCQNIVGVIFFIRLPWIIGTSGALESFGIVSTCNVMSILTALSMSAIATNGRVTAGGTYFMISRSLGPSFGGSVGFLFFCGTSISVAMYYIGTIEALLDYIAPDLAIYGGPVITPGRYHDIRIYGSILLLIMGTVVFIGVACVSRFALFAILFLVSAIFSVYTGLLVFADPETSPKICKVGDRLARYSVVYINDSWQCDNKTTVLMDAYCGDTNQSIKSEACKNFMENGAELIPGVPGFQMSTFKASLSSKHTKKSHVPGLDEYANKERDLMSDIETSFVILLAIYFPSITGVESGSNYSGDLRDAQKSLPRGTVLAVIVTSTIYLSAVFLFSGSVESLLLRDKYGKSISENGDLVLSLMAWPSKWVVLAGTMTATIGAGLQALAGGPRLLQAIAQDNIVPILGFFAKKWRGEPIRALCVTYIIAEIGILIAYLDYVAPIVAMFFLMCYGFVNFAVTLQSLLDTPHWRPSFKYYHWSLTMFGSALCITVMFLCDWIYAIIALVLVTILYHYIEYKGAEKEWGDGMTGLFMTIAIKSLQKMKMDFKHTKNWRPQLLVLLKLANSSEETSFRKPDLESVHLSSMLKAGKGLSIYAHALLGNLADKQNSKIKKRKMIANCLETAGVKGFLEVVICPNLTDGISCMIQSAGLGALRPNTIIIGWPGDWIASRSVKSYHLFLDTMRNVAVCRKAAIIIKADEFPTPEDRLQGYIDVWWIVNDGGMLLLIAHLLRRTKTWGKCKLRLFSVARENDNTIQIQKDLAAYLYQLRLGGTVEVFEMSEEDMSAYVFERTLKMEERTRMLQKLYKKKKTNLHMKEAQSVLEQARSYDFLLENGTLPEIPSRQDYLPSKENVRHMTTAVKLNMLFKEKSSESSLMIINLPCVPKSPKGQANYMSFLEVLTEGLKSCLLVRGTGSEVITIFN